MVPELLLSLYCGSLFAIVFFVAPVLLRQRENKNFSGRLYGRILWRFYPVAFLLLLVYLILDDGKVYPSILMLGLGLNVGVSYWLKTYKKRLGDIDLISYNSPERSLFRRVSMFSTFLLLMNFLLSLYVLIKLKGGALAGL